MRENFGVKFSLPFSTPPPIDQGWTNGWQGLLRKCLCDESWKAIDWTIDAFGKLRIYDDAGKWTTTQLVINSTKTKGDTGLFVLLQNMKFHKPSQLRTFNMSHSEAHPKLNETMCLIFSFNRQVHEISMCIDCIFADHMQIDQFGKTPSFSIFLNQYFH